MDIYWNVLAVFIILAGVALNLLALYWIIRLAIRGELERRSRGATERGGDGAQVTEASGHKVAEATPRA